MNLKTKHAAGICGANRCKAPVPAVDPENPYGLCAQHWNEWTVSGRPGLAAASKKDKVAAGTALAAGAGDALEAVKAELEPLRGSLEQALRSVAAVVFDQVIGSGTGLQFLGHCRDVARKQRDQLEEKRKVLKAPHLEGGRRVDATFKAHVDTCEAIIDTCTKRLEEYARAQAGARMQALSQVDAGMHDEHTLAVAHGQASAPLPEEVDVRTVFKFKVLDFNAIPREFLLLNEKLLDQYIRAKKGVVSIPGIEVYEDIKVVAS